MLNMFLHVNIHTYPRWSANGFAFNVSLECFLKKLCQPSMRHILFCHFVIRRLACLFAVSR